MMQTKTHINPAGRVSGWLVSIKFYLIVICLIGLSACGGDPDDEGGLIGTGIFNGTVSETKLLAAQSVAVKARGGERFSVPLTRSRRFVATEELVVGDEPYLIRTDLGNNEYRYAIAYKDTTRNIHSYSDVVLRNWFATNDQQIDSEFNSEAALSNLPTEQQFNELSESLFAVVGLALESYGVTGQQLISSKYEANDTGVDEYLDKNPVIIENGGVSVLLTDPDNGIQSKATVSLDAADTIADTSSPTKVSGLRVLPSGLTEIVVLWDPATDNVGVRGYQLLRDGVLRVTTPYPVFTDTGLQPGASYSYEVVALDGSGNFAPASLSVMGSTLADVDTQPPPTPFNVESRENSSTRVRLRWSISTVEDIVSFNVYRGKPGGTIELLIRTTSTEVTDPSVSGGSDYCYRIEAVDGSGNVSERSAELCVATDGSSVTASTGGTAFVTGLNYPNIDSQDCTATLSESPVESDLTLTEPCYRVTADITVGQFADLVIPKGTILIFSQGVGITVTEQASLSVNGTKDEPVVFTGAEKLAGFWRGIEFDRASKAANQIVNSVIEYAGFGQQDAGLLVFSTVGSPAQLRVEGSLIRFNKGQGFAFAGLGASIVFSGNFVRSNEKVAGINVQLLNSIDANNDLTGNREQIIDVGRLSVVTPLVIPNLGVPIKMNGLLVEQADLVIEAGVEIKFQPDTALELDGGNLIVRGTAEKKVLLTRRDPDAGNWGGVHIRNSQASVLDNITIEYGGVDPLLQKNANLALSNSTVSVNSVVLRRSSGYGYVLENNSQLSNPAAIELDENALPQP